MKNKKEQKNNKKKLYWVFVITALLGVFFCLWWNRVVYDKALNFWENEEKEKAYEWFGYYLEVPMSFSKVSDAHLKRGEYLESKDCLDASLHEFLLARRFNKNDKSLNLKISQISIKLGRLDFSRYFLEHIIKNDSRDSEAWSLLGYSYYLSNQKERARSSWEKAIEVERESAWANWYLGSLYFDEDWEGSREKLLVVSERDGFEKQKNAREFLDFLEKYDLSDRSIDYLRVVLSRAFLEAGEHELALVYINKVLDFQKNYRDAWVVRGSIYESQGKNDLARKDFVSALELDPENKEIQGFLEKVK